MFILDFSNDFEANLVRESYKEGFTVVWDSGATKSLTSVKEDFVDNSYVPFTTPIQLGGLASGLQALGEGVVTWSIATQDGQYRHVEATAFYCPSAMGSLRRIVSPQQYAKYYKENNDGDELELCIRAEQTLLRSIHNPLAPTILIEYHPQTNLPISQAHYAADAPSIEAKANAPHEYKGDERNAQGRCHRRQDAAHDDRQHRTAHGPRSDHREDGGTCRMVRRRYSRFRFNHAVLLLLLLQVGGRRRHEGRGGQRVRYRPVANDGRRHRNRHERSDRKDSLEEAGGTKHHLRYSIVGVRAVYD